MDPKWPRLPQKVVQGTAKTQKCGTLEENCPGYRNYYDQAPWAENYKKTDPAGKAVQPTGKIKKWEIIVRQISSGRRILLSEPLEMLKIGRQGTRKT